MGRIQGDSAKDGAMEKAAVVRVGRRLEDIRQDTCHTARAAVNRQLAPVEWARRLEVHLNTLFDQVECNPNRSAEGEMLLRIHDV